MRVLHTISQPSGRAEQLAADHQGEIVSAYVLVGSTAIFIWDVLNNLRNDYMLLFKQRFHVASGAYVVCRVASLVYLLGFTIFYTQPIQACNTAFVAFSSFYPLITSASTFLFLFRVRAIYGGDRLVTATFGFLWLTVVGTSMTIPLSGNAIGLGNPHECVVVNVGAYTGSAGIALTVYDTLVFFAISYRLVSNFRESEGLTRGEQVRAFFSGASLPAFSKAVFTDGQIYYMITAATNGVTILLVYVPSAIPGANPMYHGVMAIPSMTLTSIMACRVYRNTKLRVLSDTWELSLPTLSTVGSSGGLPRPLSVVQLSTQRYGVDSEGDTSDSTGSKRSTGFPAGMHHDLQGVVR
ncbi:hypothetical protein DFH09DRAFT_1374344 [Mycena vulgaris]|nr:hypothetical protein DFH09DRAFT_1374344 [Mycena vulgaris]